MDIRAAFLLEDVPKDQSICMRRPSGLTDTQMPDLVAFFFELRSRPSLLTLQQLRNHHC
eukprot:gene8428-17375_t